MIFYRIKILQTCYIFSYTTEDFYLFFETKKLMLLFSKDALNWSKEDIYNFTKD